MPVVRCPSCNRALNLPETIEISTAQCPLCGTAFPVPSPVTPAPFTPPPTPRAGYREVDSSSTPIPSLEGPSDDLPPGPDRQAVYSAGAWMQTAGTLGLLHLFFCSCMTMTLFDSDVGIVIFCGVDILQLIASLIVYNAAGGLQRRASTGWVVTAGILSLLVGVLNLLLAAIIMLKVVFDLHPRGRPDPDSSIMLGVSALVNLVIAVAFLGAGIKALLAASRPGVRKGFLR